jgi:flagellar secretion chaperone FliS
MANRVSIYLEQEILSATGLQLVHLLYQAVMTELRDARSNLAKKEIAGRCRNISKACEMLGELRGSLNHEAGGEIAERLNALYCYMLSRLLDANLHQQDEPLAEVLGLLSTLDEAWKQLAAEQPGAEQLEAPSERIPHPAFALGDAPDTLSHAWSL